MATASDLITDARKFANDIMSQAQAWLGNATSLAGTFYEPVLRENLDVDKLDLSGFEIGDVPTFNETFTMPGGEPTMGHMETLYIPSLPSFGAAPPPLDTSNLFQTPKPVFQMPEFDLSFPDITTEFDIPPAPVLTFPPAPDITPVQIDAVDLELPTILDPEVFTDTYQTPTPQIDPLELEPGYLPDPATMPAAPPPLDTSGLFQTLKPTFDLGAFDVPGPEVRTEFEMPEAPVLMFPDAPTLQPVTLPEVAVDVPEVADPPTFQETYTPPDSAPQAPELEPYQAPEAPEFPEAPPPLDTRDLWKTEKPNWNLPDFDAQPPEINTDVAFPEEPVLEYPEPPTPTPVTIQDPSIAVPEVADPEAFDGVYTPPDTAPAAPELEPLERPDPVAFPASPPPLDTSDLWKTPKPNWNLPDFDAQPPDIDTAVPIPEAPDIVYPEPPPVTPVPVPDPSVDIPSIDEPEPFTGTYEPPNTAPQEPTFEPLLLPEVPEFPDPPPPLDTSELFKTQKPDWTAGEFDVAPPEINTSFPLPEAPVIQYPEPPTVHPLDLGEAPEVVLPTFDDEFDGIEPVAPDLAGRFAEEALAQRPLLQAFVSDQLDQWVQKFALAASVSLQQNLADKLSAGLAGGTGLPDSFETNLYSRARARIDAEQEAAYAQIQASLVKRGFVYPPGAMTAALNALTRDYANRLAAFAQETAIERTKMEQQHAQFVMQAASALQQAAQQAAIGYATVLVQINGQAVDYAKTLVAQLAEIYNGALELYKVKTALYQTKAQVFETRLKAALAGLDRYRLELEAAKARKELDALDVQLYESRLTAEVRRMEVYSAELAGVKILADLERLKIELFNGQVEGFLGTVRAQEAKFSAYKTAIEGDTARVSAYGQEVAAFGSAVDAVGKKADVQLGRSRIVIDYNQALNARYQVGLERYRTDIQAEQARFSSAVEAYRASLDAYQASLKAKLDRVNAQIEEARLRLDAAKTRKDVDQLDVQIYAEMMRALSVKAEIYASQLKGVTTRIDAEKLKLDLFEGRVRAFLAQAQAEEGKFTAFRVATEADTARVSGYGQEVAAFSAAVDAKAKEGAFGIDRARLLIENNQSRNEAYRSELERYRVDIQAEQARMASLVEVYRAQLEAYQTAIRAKLDRVNAEIEEARLALETAKARKDVDALDVQIYTARMQALSVRAEIYAQQLKGVTTRIEAEKLKLDLFEGRTRAFLAQAQAEEGKFTAFRVATEADTARVSGYGQEVAAFSAAVDAKAKEGAFGIDRARLTFEHNRELNERYRIGLERYKVDIDAEQARFSSLLEQYKAGLEAYQAALSARMQRLDGEIKQAQLNIELVRTRKDLDELDVRLYATLTDVQAKRNEVYLGQLRAVQIQGELERLKIDVYDGLVKGFSARAQAEESKFSAFKVAVDADTARVSGYGQEMAAFNTRVDAVAKEAEIGFARSRAINEQNQQRIEAYRSALERFKVDVQVEHDRFTAGLEAYRTALSGYEIALKAKLERLDAEIKQAELNIERARAQKDVDLIAVQEFTAQLEGLRTRASVYATQIEAVKSRAQVEEMKVSMFDSRVKAFLGMLQAEGEKFSAYEAATKGDIARVEGYRAQMGAYDSLVSAEAKRADVDMEHGRLVMEANKNVLAQYQAELEAYKTRINAEISRFGGHAEAYRVLLAAFQSELATKTQVLDAQVKAKQMEVQIATAQAEANLRVNTTNSQLAQKGLEMTVQAAVTAGTTSGSMAQAALSGLNALAVVDAQNDVV